MRDKLSMILKYATMMHEGQKRSGGSPYITHPIAVVDILITFGYTQDKYAVVGYLHDVVEDTSATLFDLKQLGVNNEELNAIDLLTKKDGYEINTYLYAISNVELAKVVKLADRLHNLQSARVKGVSKKFRIRYIEETEKYYLNLAQNTCFYTPIIEVLDVLKYLVTHDIKGVD